MAKGKGAPDHWVAVVKPGKILFEMEGVTIGGRDRGDAFGVAQAGAAHHAGEARRGKALEAARHQLSAVSDGGEIRLRANS